MASTKGLVVVLTLLLAAAFLVAGAAEQTQARKEGAEAAVVPRGYRRGGISDNDAHGSGCRRGCCGTVRGGGCRCCANADDEVPESMYRRPAVEVHN